MEDSIKTESASLEGEGEGEKSYENDINQVHVKVENNVITPNNNHNSDDDENQNNTKRRKSNSGGSGLTLEQKKENHILSENRRRAQIRSTFDKLVKIVPQLQESESRSELAVLTKTSNYIEHLRSEYERLQTIRKQRGLPE